MNISFHYLFGPRVLLFVLELLNVSRNWAKSIARGFNKSYCGLICWALSQAWNGGSNHMVVEFDPAEVHAFVIDYKMYRIVVRTKV